MPAHPSVLCPPAMPYCAAVASPCDGEPDAVAAGRLRARGVGAMRVLIVEDHPLIAAQLALDLREEGHHVVGPFRNLADVDLTRLEVDAAILDVCLGADQSYPLAESLRDRGLPVVFYTGSSACHCPESLRDVPWLAKPAASSALTAALRREALRLRGAQDCLRMVQELRDFAAHESGADPAVSDLYVARALRQALAQLHYDGLTDPKAWLQADIIRQIRQSAEWGKAIQEQTPPSRLI